MNIATFKDLAGAVQSVLFSIAIVIGGLWTAFIFMSTRPDKKAQYDLFSLAVLNVTVEASQLDIDDQGGLFISVSAKLVNDGNRMTYIQFKEAPFKVSRIDFGEGAFAKRAGAIVGWNVTRDPDKITETTIASKGWDYFHAFVRVPEPGYYYVEFSGKLDQSDMAGLGNKEGAVWWGATNVLVKRR